MLFLKLFAPQMSITFSVTTFKDRHYQQNIHMREVAYIVQLDTYLPKCNQFSQMSFQQKAAKLPRSSMLANGWISLLSFVSNRTAFRISMSTTHYSANVSCLWYFSPWYGLSHVLLYLCVKFTVQLTCKVFNCCTLLCLGGEVSKHQGVLFDRRLFSSRCSDELYIAIFLIDFLKFEAKWYIFDESLYNTVF